MKCSGRRFFMVLVAVVLTVLVMPPERTPAVDAKKTVRVSQVAITNPSGKSLTINVGSTYRLGTKVKPSNASNKNLRFQSSNSKVVTVSASGKITAKKKGTAKITVTAKDGSRRKAVLTVKAVIPVDKVIIKTPNTKNMVLLKGNSYTVTTEVKPVNAFNKKLSYSTSDSKVLSVTNKGKIKGIKNGTAVLTVKAADGSGKKASCKVTVKTLVTNVNIAETAVTKEEGTIYHIAAKVTPADASTKTLQYTSSNTQLAAVDKNGKVTLKKAGTVKITVTATDGSRKSAVCTIRIQNAKAAEITKDGYALVWKDDFDGNELNTSNWCYAQHESGWINNELEEYTNSKNNVYVKNGDLIIQAIKTVGANGTTYTSGMIHTRGKRDYLYGRFEIRAKVPEGKGFLPAFWMMPTDESLYGGWPTGGENDIMEIRGSNTSILYATLHYGDPHRQQSASYTLSGSKFSSGYHIYSCEWEPTEIRYYVDGILYHTVKEWYTKRPGEQQAAYPAPFNQKFYLILNLAVGGNWPGYPDETTKFGENAKFMVDYVKVYQKQE